MRENLREMRDENLGDNYQFKASLVAHQVAELLAIETGGADKINSKWVKSLRKDTLNHMMLSMIGLGVHENPEFYDVKPYRTNKIASSIRDSQRELQYRLKQAEYERTGQLRNLQYLNNMIINYGKIFVR
jgi:methyltransferase-like protein